MDLIHQQTSWSIKSPLFPRHMTFIAGPRQCGKTTMCLQYLSQKKLDKNQYYFNWDRFDVRQKFNSNLDWLSTLKINAKRPILIFDEIHKVNKWKRLLKGIYDHYRDDFQFIITGSGRLDYFQRGGDSLAGRFDLYELFPFTPAECLKFKSQNELLLEEILSAHPLSEDLIKHWEMTGGFPEPFLTGSENKSKRWWQQYLIRVTEEDLKDLTKLESVDLMRHILQIVPAKISAPLSIDSIRRDVDSTHATIKRYINTLSQLYLIFAIAPYAKKIHRSITKEKKYYFYHHAAVLDEGARFENMVAIIIKRWICEKNEKALGHFELFYLRDQDRREVDFIIVKDSKPYFLIECKKSETSLSNSLIYFSEKLKVPGLQVVRTAKYNLKKTSQLAVASIHYLAKVLG